MAVNAFLSFFDKADGESTQKGKEKWVEIQGWSWDVQAESTWAKGGGASVGKPKPGRFSFQHYFDTTSAIILNSICSGNSFPKVQVQMMKTTGRSTPETYLTLTMEGVYITGVASSGTEEGNVVQQVDMVFKTIKIEYKMQDPKNGKLVAGKTFNWDVPSGTTSAT